VPTLLIASIAIAMREARVRLRVQTIVMLLAAVAIEPLMELRPQMFTYALMAALLAILARENWSDRALLWPIVLLFVGWANLHGGFAVGLAVLTTYAGITALGVFFASRTLKRAVRLWAVTIAAILVTLVNPQGVGLWRTILYALRDPGARVALIEWHPLIPSMVMQWQTSFGAGFVYVVPMLMFVSYGITFLAAWDRETLALDGPAVLLIAAAFDATRNMALGVIGLATPLAHHADRLLERIRGVDAGDLGRPSDARALISAPLAILLAIVILLSGGFFAPRLRAAYECPVGAVAFMQQHDLNGNILSELNWGQYLLWHLGPRSKVFIDGRTHLVYSPKILHDYLEFQSGLVSADAIARQYPIDFILIAPSAAPFKMLAASPHWKLIYRDRVSVLFARSGSPAAVNVPATVVGEAPITYFP